MLAQSCVAYQVARWLSAFMTDTTSATQRITDGSDWLTPAEVSQRQKISVRTLAQWRYLGRGPRFAHFGKHVRYHRDDVEQWEADQLVDPSAA